MVHILSVSVFDIRRVNKSASLNIEKKVVFGHISFFHREAELIFMTRFLPMCYTHS